MTHIIVAMVSAVLLAACTGLLSPPSCPTCVSPSQMRDEYQANPLRAEEMYVGKRFDVSGKIKKFDGSGVLLKDNIPMSFAPEHTRGWLTQKNKGDRIEANCIVTQFFSSVDIEFANALFGRMFALPDLKPGTPHLTGCRPIASGD